MTGSLLVAGASRGIGAAIAHQAATAGFEVVVTYNGSQAAAETIVRNIHAEGGVAHIARADMGEEADIVDLFRFVDDTCSPLAAVIYNAGVNLMAPITEFEADAFDHLFAINVRGAFLVAREAARRLGRGGVIVNISSVSARTGGGPAGTIYASSKGALDTFTRGLAKELAQRGIRVCGLRPGMTETEIFDNNIGLDEARRLAAQNVPVGRMAHPDEIAKAAIWLCSDAASYVTGTMMDVTGGL